jgi:hypothetical protein
MMWGLIFIILKKYRQEYYLNYLIFVIHDVNHHKRSVQQHNLSFDPNLLYLINKL